MRPRNVALYTCAYLLLLLIGQLALEPGSSSPLLWPAAGVAAAWSVRSRDRREFAVALGVTTTVTLAFFAVLGSGWAPTVLLIIGTVAIALFPRLVMRPGRSGSVDRASRRVVLRRPHDLVLLLTGCLAGGAVSAGLVAAAVATSTGSVTPIQLVGWLLGNTVGAFLVAGAILSVLGVRAARVEESASRSVRWPRTAGRPERLALVVTALIITLAVFGPGQTLALTFLVLLVVVWAGMRLTPGGAALTGLLLAGVAVVLVRFFSGGPLDPIRSPELQVIVLQSYCGVAFTLTLLLSLITTERDELSVQLQHSQREAQDDVARLRAVTDNTREGVLVIDQFGTHLFRNEVAERLLASIGPLDADQHHIPLGRLHGMDGRVLARKELPMARALAGEVVRDFPVRYRPEDGKPLARQTWSVDAVPVRRNAQGRPERVLILIRDITASQERVEQLEAFAATVAHDLQGPITGVIGWSETAADQIRAGAQSPAELLPTLTRIDRSAHRAQDLINDLLAYSTARTAALAFGWVDLDAMIDAVGRELVEQHPETMISITHGELGSVRADRRLIRQVFSNLLGNAVKYTVPQRPPRVHVSAHRGQDLVTINVSDNGIGVRTDQRKTIFEPFERGQAAGRYPGTGLGLAICAQVVRQHGGSIRVTDRPGGPGSSFIFSLADVPFEEPDPDEVTDGTNDVAEGASATTR